MENGQEPKRRWSIHYSDGTSFKDSDGDPRDAPSWDVQVVAQAHPQVGRQLLSKSDFFIYIPERDEWIAVDFTGVIDYMANVLGVVKVGRMIGTTEFNAAYERAMDDPYLPEKSGFIHNEARP